MNVDELLQRLLRELPPRRAPHTLESRVLAELQRRAVQPWWRRSFVHWPIAARSGFVVVCAALIALALTGDSWMATPASSWLRHAVAITSIAGNFAASLAGAIPRWLNLLLAAAALLYAFLFGLGAAAYRLLYLQPQNGR
jgi:hypothetical protein